MTEEELEKEAEEIYTKTDKEFMDCQDEGEIFNLGYLAGAEPREKRIADLEAQIEKMKRCEICEHSGTYLPICYSNEPCKNKDKFELRR